MEEFTKVDIFDTKGVEYLFVIGYLLILIFFWNFVKNPARVIGQIKEAVSTLSAGILRIPQGIFFTRQHTWSHLDTSGHAMVGVDDFLQHAIGRVKVSGLKYPGEPIQKGDLMTELDQSGKKLKVYSPISGTIVDTNRNLENKPEEINDDPYNKGWIYKIKPSDWVDETNACLLADDASEWATNEFVRFKDFLTGEPGRKYSSEPAMVLLQDGGEMRDNILSELPDEVWNKFQQEFRDLRST